MAKNIAKEYMENRAEKRNEKRINKQMEKEARKQLRAMIPLKDRITKKLVKKIIIAILIYLVLFDLAFVFLYPFITMIIDSVKSEADLLNSTVKWIPSGIEWSNYKVAFEGLQYSKYIWNSVFVTAVATIGHAFVCSFIGYGLARYKFPGKNLIFIGVVLSMLVPTQVLIFPLYQTYGQWHWLDSFLPLLVPCFVGFGLRGGFYIFLFRQFFLGLPWEMEEAARIDGCGCFKTFFRIMRPMARSSILVCTVLSIVWHWNDYFEPNIYLNQSPELLLLPARLPSMYEQLNVISSEAENIELASDVIINQAICMASTFIVILPLLIAYMFVQKQFMEGVERSGLTGM